MPEVEPVLAALERAPEIVIPLVKEVPERILKRRPLPKKWSAHEHACHLAVVHPVLSARLDLMLSDPAPRITPYLPSAEEEDGALLRLDLVDSMKRFAEDRRRLLDRARGLSPRDWERTAEHGEYGHYSIFIMFRHLALHDMLHAYRIEELLLKKDWD